MTKTKKILVTIMASMAAGAMLGMLYAPYEGAETRKKLGNIKRRFTGGEDDEIESYDRETLEELRSVLRRRLDKIDERLANELV